MKIELTNKQNEYESVLKPTLNESEKSILKLNEDNINSSFKELTKFIEYLKKQIDFVNESIKQKEQLNKLIEDINNDLTIITKQFETPQFLIIAEDEARKTEAINLRIKNVETQTKKFEIWIEQNLPNNELEKLSLLNLNNNILLQNDKLNKFIMPLTESINNTKQLDEQKKLIVTKLDSLTEQAKNIHNLENTDEKSKQLLVLKKDIQNLQKKLEILKENAKQPNSYILQFESLEFDPVVDNLLNLTNILNSEEQNVTQNLANTAAKVKILNNFDIIQNGIQKAEKIDADPKAIVDDLHSAVTILQNLQPHFDDIEQIYITLDLTNFDANQLKNETFHQLIDNSETSKTLCQSLLDRIDSLQLFNINLNEIIDQIKNTNEQLNNLKLANASSTEIDNVLKNSQNILPNILALSELIDSLSPLSEPSNQKEALLQNFNQLINDITKARENVEQVEKYKDDVNKFIKELEPIEFSITNIEQNCSTINTKKEIENLIQKDLNNLHKLLETFEFKVAPNDDLRKRQQQLKNRIAEVEKNAITKQDQIIEQQKLLDQFEKVVETNKKTLDELSQRYDSPQSINNAKEDVNCLKSIRELFIALPLDNLNDKQLRDNLLKCIQPLNIKANVIFF